VPMPFLTQYLFHNSARISQRSGKTG